VSKLPRTSLQPLLDRVADKLPAWRGQLMHHSGRLTLIKTTLSTMSIYTFVSLGLPQWLQKALQKVMKAFLWTGNEEVRNGKCLVAWSRVQRPFHLGGLGILDLKRMGMALCLCWQWFQRTDPSKPWSKLLINVDSCTDALFDASLNIIPGNGKNILFWSDTWLEGSRLVDRWPDLVTVVPLRHRRKLTLDSALRNSRWIRDICGPLTVLIILQYLDAKQCIDHIQLQVEEPDRFVWRWTASGQYSSKSAYESMFVGESSILGSKELWKSRTPKRCRFFIWLSLLGRCWTGDRLLKHGL
jgi:hypothetical protein